MENRDQISPLEGHASGTAQSHYPEISQDERFPLLTLAGRRLLHAMRQHPHAPIWNWPNGEQLDAEGLESVEKFAQQLRANAAALKPAWLDEFAQFCVAEVPFYRNRHARLALSRSMQFESLPSCSREDLAPRVWDFVPDRQSIDQLIVFSTSGTTGHPTKMLSHPATAACGVPLLEHALTQHDLGFSRGPESVAITNVAAYRDAFTTAIVVAWLKEAGCLRVNLHPSAWRSANDRREFINYWQAPIWLGDPIAFEQMLTLDINHAPQAILSSIMRMPEKLAENLRSRYGCPIIDIIAMTEVGLLAMKTDGGHVVLPHDVYVEILDEHDQVLPAGGRGEVTVTCARNPLMPLLRYRTGDFAAISRQGSRTVLLDYEGRMPVQFPLKSGRVVHSMEVTRLLRRHPLMQYRLHQQALDHFEFAYRGHVDDDALRSELSELLERPSSLVFCELELGGGMHKVVEYWSAVPSVRTMLGYSKIDSGS